MNKKEIIIIILLLVIVTALHLYLQYLIANIYFNDPKLDQTQQRIHDWHDSNMQLNDEYLHEASYTNIASEAALSGFIPAPFVTP